MNLEAPKESVPILERARRYLDRCPPAISGQNGHNTTFRVACALVHGFALSEAEALAVLAAWNARCQPPWSEGELHHKVVSAANAPGNKPRGYLAGGMAGRRTVYATTAAAPRPPALPPKKTEFQPETLKRVAALAPEVDAQYVKDRSPLWPETQTPATFLQRLFLPGETVVVLDRRDSQGTVVCTMGDGPFDARCLDYLTHGCKDGVLFLCAPVDGKYHPNPRQGNKLSRRSQEAVTSWRYFMVESDNADPKLWLAALAQMPLRIAAIYTSGRRSIHALVRLNAASKEDFDARVKRLEPALHILGGDPKAGKAVQLTRLPGCYRDEEGPPRAKGPVARRRFEDDPLEFDEQGDPIWTPKPEPDLCPASAWTGGKLQELLYLDPAPDGKPIRSKPTRQEIYRAWVASMETKEGNVCQ